MPSKLEQLIENKAARCLWLFTAVMCLVTMCLLVACYKNDQLQDTVAGLKITSSAFGLSVVSFALLGGCSPCLLCSGLLNSPYCLYGADIPLPLAILMLGAFLGVILIDYTGFALPLLCQGATSGLLIYETIAVINSPTRSARHFRGEISTSSKATLIAGSVISVLATLMVVVLNYLWYRVTRPVAEDEQRLSVNERMNERMRKYLLKELEREREREERRRKAEAEYEEFVREEEEQMEREAKLAEVKHKYTPAQLS